MTEDQFDGLVDNATHAVNDLIPGWVLEELSASQRSEMLIRINDALTPILREAIDNAVPACKIQTRACTIAALIGELVETHIDKCEKSGGQEEDRPPHVISEIHGTSASIDSIASCEAENGASQIYLVLDDGTAFRITVERVEQ
ncbi:hypothetical protein [Sphingopyxis sp. GC21]|uniref:hypothetical protein n=1 Tax=Sphingopyxis sp. GC21 TaxID=2933562 RepID=UPI0021E413D2|nr:hypothetical protein [Sphingopyxis sp. GC21]